MEQGDADDRDGYDSENHGGGAEEGSIEDSTDYDDEVRFLDP
jgi:hypothetical protein